DRRRLLAGRLRAPGPAAGPSWARASRIPPTPTPPREEGRTAWLHGFPDEAPALPLPSSRLPWRDVELARSGLIVAPAGADWQGCAAASAAVGLVRRERGEPERVDVLRQLLGAAGVDH